MLLVAGDLFSELARPDALRETIRHWQDVFADFLAGGGTILTLTGNHDNENFCQTLVHAMTLAAPTVGKAGELVPPGRLYLAADPTFLRLDRPRARRATCSSSSCRTRRRPATSRARPGRSTAARTRRTRSCVAAFDAGAAPTSAPPEVRPEGADRAGGPRPRPRVDRSARRCSGSPSRRTWWWTAAAWPTSSTTWPSATSTSRSASAARARPLLRQHRADGPGRAGATRRAWWCSTSAPTAGTGEPAVLPLPATAGVRAGDPQPGRRPAAAAAEYAGRQGRPGEPAHHVHGRRGQPGGRAEATSNELFPRWYARDWQETAALGPSLAGGRGPVARASARRCASTWTQELVQHTEADRDAILAIADGLLKEME